MLALRLFKIEMAIIVHFDLEVKQYNVINAFIYAFK